MVRALAAKKTNKNKVPAAKQPASKGASDKVSQVTKKSPSKAPVAKKAPEKSPLKPSGSKKPAAPSKAPPSTKVKPAPAKSSDTPNSKSRPPAAPPSKAKIPSAPPSKAKVAVAPPKANVPSTHSAPLAGKSLPKMPPAPSRPLTPPRAITPPAAPTQIPMPPRPPGPPLLRQITHLESAQAQKGMKLTLAIGDKAVHPRHGVGEVIAIETRDIGGTKGEFYVLRLLDDATKKIMVPTNATNAGLRAIMDPNEADTVLETMRAKEVAVNEHPWSRRFRAYTEMINSGSPYEVAKVMRDMYRLKFDKDLSFGERRLLDQARSLLMKELALAKKIPEEELQAEVARIFDLPTPGAAPTAAS